MHHLPSRINLKAKFCRALGKSLCSASLTLASSNSTVSPGNTGTASCSRISPLSISSYKTTRNISYKLRVFELFDFKTLIMKYILKIYINNNCPFSIAQNECLRNEKYVFKQIKLKDNHIFWSTENASLGCLAFMDSCSMSSCEQEVRECQIWVLFEISTGQ